MICQKEMLIASVQISKMRTSNILNKVAFVHFFISNSSKRFKGVFTFSGKTKLDFLYFFFFSCMCKYSVCPFLIRIHSNFSSHKACLLRDASMEDSKYHLRAAATLNLKNNMSTAPQRNVFQMDR